MRTLSVLRRQARFWLEYSGWERRLVYADVVLSVLSVLIYILSTYQLRLLLARVSLLLLFWLLLLLLLGLGSALQMSRVCLSVTKGTQTCPPHHLVIQTRADTNKQPRPQKKTARSCRRRTRSCTSTLR